MAKDQPKTEPKTKAQARKPTPFEKFDRLAKRIIRVPKDQARDKSS